MYGFVMCGGSKMGCVHQWGWGVGVERGEGCPWGKGLGQLT